MVRTLNPAQAFSHRKSSPLFADGDAGGEEKRPMGHHGGWVTCPDVPNVSVGSMSRAMIDGEGDPMRPIDGVALDELDCDTEFGRGKRGCEEEGEGESLKFFISK